MPSTLLETLRQAGFKGEGLRTAWAIAKRESGGRPDAFNGNSKTGDRSFGLFQINTLGALQARVQQYGLKSERDLFDPVTNARVAFQMSKGGTDFGAWGHGPNAYRKMPALNYAGFPGGGPEGHLQAGVVPRQAPARVGAGSVSPDKRAMALALINYSNGGGSGGLAPLLAAFAQPAPTAPPVVRATPSVGGQEYASSVAPGADPYGISRYGAPSIRGGYTKLGTPGQGTHGDLPGWQSRNAYDLGTPVGTPVYAQFDGTVDPNRYGSLNKGGRFAGLRVNVAGRRNASYDAHLSRLVVKPGQRVRAGDLLGYSGSANGSPHLHHAVKNL